MKKNISINISGIIFHIEEDAYEKLRDYLDSINKYFSSFDDSMEIIADIESRIAEIFLAKLNENKQVINQEDIEELITTMGSIKDFQAVEDPLESDSDFQEQDDSGWKETGTTGRKLYRDEQRKLLGGVLAGIAHYFKVDPLWIRLLFILLFIGSYGTMALVYAVMWIVVPGSFELPENKKLKKMYRNPEGKVIGGVASGISTYFGVDVAVVRLLFVILTIAGGTGLIAYVILWIILPEASSITDKVKMQGEPVTLSNIESNIKSSLNVKDKDGEENIFVKILLFPFRLIATIINGLGKALGPVLTFLVHFIRVAIGVILVIMGLSGVFTLVVLVSILIGILSSGLWGSFVTGDIGFPIELIAETFPTFSVVAAFFAGVIPCIFAILLGISVVAKRVIFNATVGWSLFAIFFISSAIISVNIPATVYKFREEGEYRVTQNFTIEKVPVLSLKEVGMEEYEVTRLRLRGHEGPDYRVEQIFESQGSSRQKANENAQMVDYTITLEKDSMLVFDSNITFKEDAKFRGQSLDMTLYIPYDTPFMMSSSLEHIIYNTIHRGGYNVWDMPNNMWEITKDDGLHCITCEEEEENNEISGRDGTNYRYEDFRSVEIRNAYTINIIKDDRYDVEIIGDQDDLEGVEIEQDGDKLIFGYDKAIFRDLAIDRDKIKINIRMPEILEIDMVGASRLYLNDFQQSRMSINLSGASFTKADIDIDDLKIDLTGASELQLSGKGREMLAEVSGASQLNAYDYEVQTAQIDVHAAASARVFVTEDLEIEETLAGTVKYKGNPRVKQ